MKYPDYSLRYYETGFINDTNSALMSLPLLQSRDLLTKLNALRRIFNIENPENIVVIIASEITTKIIYDPYSVTNNIKLMVIEK